MIRSEETQSVHRSCETGIERRRLADDSPAVSGAAERPEDAAPSAAEEAAGAETALARALWDTLADMVFVVRRDGTILSFHAPADCEYPLSGEGLIGRRVKDLLPIAIAQQAMYYVEKTLRTSTRQNVCCPYPLPGRLRTFQIRTAVCGVGEVLAVLRDVTDRSQMEKELLEISHREQSRIGQDLHDGLGQHLTGITFLSRALEKKLAARGLPEAAEASEVSRLIMQALSQTRSLARGLFPVELEGRGLLAAFRELVATVERLFGISCVLECDETLDITDQTVGTHLFRLAQEALSNAARHGKAKHIVVEIRRNGSKISLTIRDDGAGFPVERGPSSGLGLRIMHYRAQRVGGSLDVSSRVGGGTVVTCTFSAPSPALPVADATLPHS
jgi:two-component system, LuxR family, sensor kinase FixL